MVKRKEKCQQGVNLTLNGHDLISQDLLGGDDFLQVIFYFSMGFSRVLTEKKPLSEVFAVISPSWSLAIITAPADYLLYTAASVGSCGLSSFDTVLYVVCD